jgi:phosphoribosylglycinamide formyltransferase-1
MDKVVVLLNYNHQVMSSIAVFASGSGSNAENIVDYLKKAHFDLDFYFFTNNKKAYIIDRARKMNVSVTLFSREEFYESDKIVEKLKECECDLVVLAGFLWLVPQNLVKAFKGRIINIHPALLPKYGGKGMYGRKIHEAIVANKETETGITIHYVDEKYDEGRVIFQARCVVNPGDTPEIVEEKVHELEYKYYPKVIEEILTAK